MLTFGIITVTLFILAAGALIFREAGLTLVAEDHVAVTVNRYGFINRVLSPGQYRLRPFERVEFMVETRTKLARGSVSSVATEEGILVKLDWSGIYALRPGQISDNRSQRLRSLPNADKAIARNADILLRKLIGGQAVNELFNPTTRERLERQLGKLVADRLQMLGIEFKSINLQAIELPLEVAEAHNKAKAIETLDGAIRQTAPITREVIRGAYQLDEILHWDSYLPVPSRLTMKKMEAA